MDESTMFSLWGLFGFVCGVVAGVAMVELYDRWKWRR